MFTHRPPFSPVVSALATSAPSAGVRAPHRRLRACDLPSAAHDGPVAAPPASPPAALPTPPRSPLPPHAPERAIDPAALPGVWRADACAAPADAWPTGHVALDAQLPGGGWPAGGLVELLCAQPGLYEGALLAPYWAHITQAQPAGRLAWVMLGHSPWRLHAPGLARLGLQPQQLLCLQPATEADAAWAVEQMLHSSGITGIWWLTRHAQSQHLRRLQWAAQSRGIPLFASRPLSSRSDPSPAPLRLHLQAGPDQALRVHILKRQGPRHEQPLDLPCTTPLHLLPRRRVLAQPLGECAVQAAANPLPQPHHVVDRPVPASVAA